MMRIENLIKRFDGREVLKDVEFQVNAGEVFGLLGGNGAGKSTAIGIIAGLLAPDAGRVTIEEERSAGRRRERIGLAPQETALYPTLTCEENLRFFGRLYGLRGPLLRERVDSTVEAAGLAEYRRARTDTLSGGWKRRLNLAAALVHSPPVLLLDEPTAGLDVEARQGVWRLIEDVGARGAAVLLTTHLLDEAESLCDRLAILVAGRIAAQGTMVGLRSLVPARELAIVECADSQRARARELELEVRDYAGRLTLLLPERTTVSALIERLGELDVRSITLQSVSLLHIYLEVTRGRDVEQPTGAGGRSQTGNRLV